MKNTFTMSNQRLKLWELVAKTPEGIIKEIDSPGRGKLKTVPGINRIKKATEIFGIYGSKWGLKSLNHNIERIGNISIATLDAVFFVDTEDYKTEFEISTSSSVMTKTNGEWEVNATYRKALETDLKNKALSLLGFFADIYTDEELISSDATGSIQLTEDDLISIEGEDENGTD